jgi:hypothetical protein
MFFSNSAVRPNKPGKQAMTRLCGLLAEVEGPRNGDHWRDTRLRLLRILPGVRMELISL